MPGKTYKYNSVEGCLNKKEVHINNLAIWANHLRKCSICREQCPPEIAEEIKVRYGTDLGISDEVVPIQEEKEEMMAMKTEEETLDSKEKQEELMQAELEKQAAAELNQHIAKLPCIGTMSGQIDFMGKQITELANGVKSMVERLVPKPPEKESGIPARFKVDEETDEEVIDVEDSQPMGSRPPLGDQGGQAVPPKQTIQQQAKESGSSEDLQTPEQVEMAKKWLKDQEAKLGMKSGPQAQGQPQQGQPQAVQAQGGILDGVGAAVKGLTDLVKIFKGGGEQAPPTMEGLANEILKSVVASTMQKKDPIEYLTAGMKFQSDSFSQAVKLVATAMGKQAFAEPEQKKTSKPQGPSSESVS